MEDKASTKLLRLPPKVIVLRHGWLCF